MNAFRLALTITTLFFVVACSDKQPTEPAEKPTGVIPQAQLDALNKAKGVEGTLMKADEQRQEQVDQ